MTKKNLTEAEMEEKRQLKLAKQREYNRIHADKINLLMKDYHKKPNRQMWLTEKITCECGCITTNHSKYEHVKTLKHQNFMENQNIILSV